jgi:hypothetical protein
VSGSASGRGEGEREVDAPRGESRESGTGRAHKNGWRKASERASELAREKPKNI